MLCLRKDDAPELLRVVLWVIEWVDVRGMHESLCLVLLLIMVALDGDAAPALALGLANIALEGGARSPCLLLLLHTRPRLLGEFAA
jgi:hypothetical protein